MWRVCIFIDEKHTIPLLNTVFENVKEAKEKLPFLKSAYFYERNRNKNVWVKNRELLDYIVIEKI